MDKKNKLRVRGVNSGSEKDRGVGLIAWHVTAREASEGKWRGAESLGPPLRLFLQRTMWINFDDGSGKRSFSDIWNSPRILLLVMSFHFPSTFAPRLFRSPGTAL